MNVNNVVITTNVSKSQIKDTGDYWLINNIPVTVDDSVMNGIYYPATENILGMPSLVGKPVTLSHPTDEDGNHVSGREGVGLENHFSGGTITKTYNVKGVNYADARIKKSLLNAQESGKWYSDTLKSKGNIGVSTGLTIPENNEAGTAKNGDVYTQTAINQEYDHLAMLEPSEAPAGGNATFMKFNAESKVIVSNVDEHMKTNEKKGLLAKIVALFGDDDEKAYNTNETGLLAENLNDKVEVANVDKKKMMGLMENMGMDMKDAENMDEETMYNAMSDYSKNMGKKKNADDKDDEEKMEKKGMKKNSTDEDMPAWAAALVANSEAQSKEIESLKASLTANAEDELNKLADEVSKLATNSIPAEQAKRLDVEFLKSHLAANGGHLNVNAMAGHQVQASKNTDEWAIEMPNTAEDK